MTRDSLAIAEHDEQLGDLLAAWIEAVESGQAPDSEEWRARHPEFAVELAEFFASQKNLCVVAEPLRAVARAAVTGSLVGEGLPRVFGDFEIEEEIGRGGMGVVYKARQKSLNRMVALKVLPFAATMDARQLQRFHNEAQAAACLHHTNIVPVHFVGSERGVHYYAMQFIEGRDLASMIAGLRRPSEPRPSGSGEKLTAPDTPLPDGRGSECTKPLAGLSMEHSKQSSEHFRSVARLGIQAAEALDHAHQMGIVHRDIKPANLLVDDTGRLWVTDFGLAQIQSDARLTLTGDLVGTLRYMSPEQALAERIVLDHRTDVYSLGATLYELLTLEPAFDGDDRQELLRQIAFEEPRRLRQRNRAIPKELGTIVLKAMEKNPAERYQTAQEVADDLRRWLENRPILARRPSIFQRAAKWCKRHVTAVTAAAAVSFLAAVGLAVAVVLIGDANAQKSSMLGEKNKALQEKDDALKREAEEKAAVVAARDRANSYLDDAVGIATSTLGKPFHEMFPEEFVAQGALLAKAVALQEKAVADLPDRPDRWHRLMQLNQQRSEELVEEQKFRQAIAPQMRAVEVCRHWISAFPNDFLARQGGPMLLVSYLVMLGGLHCTTGQLDEGEKVYAEALERLSPFDQPGLAPLIWTFCVEIHVKLGCARAEAGRYTEAAQDFDKAFALIQQRKPDVPPKGNDYDSQWEEAVLWRARCRIGQGKLQLVRARPNQARETFNLAVGDFKRVTGDGSYVNDDDLEYAWFLVTCPVKEVRNPAWAMELASKAISQEAGEDRPYRGRLAMALRVRGLANYLRGDWAACIADLERASKHGFNYDVTIFIQAMAYARLGDKKKAMSKYTRGVPWMNNQRPKDVELHRLRAEAADLLGIKDAPPADEKKAPTP